jgi:hypothetical protein
MRPGQLVALFGALHTPFPINGNRITERVYAVQTNLTTGSKIASTIRESTAHTFSIASNAGSVTIEGESSRFVNMNTLKTSSSQNLADVIATVATAALSSTGTRFAHRESYRSVTTITEEGLIEGTQVFAIGSMSRSTPHVLEPALHQNAVLISPSGVAAISDALGAQGLGYLILSFFAGLFAVALGAVAVAVPVSKLVGWLRDGPAETPRPPNPPADQSQNDLPEDISCVVCFQNRRSVCFQPCNHVSCCAACANEIMRTKICPVCRARIVRVVQVYF